MMVVGREKAVASVTMAGESRVPGRETAAELGSGLLPAQRKRSNEKHTRGYGTRKVS